MMVRACVFRWREPHTYYRKYVATQRSHPDYTYRGEVVLQFNARAPDSGVWTSPWRRSFSKVRPWVATGTFHMARRQALGSRDVGASVVLVGCGNAATAALDELYWMAGRLGYTLYQKTAGRS